MAESFEQLKLEFLAETEDTLGNLQRDLNRLGEGVGERTPEPEVVDRVFRTTHSLKGVAGMFGLDAMSAVSHAMESVFDGLREGRVPLDDALLDLLFQGNESLHRLLAHASGRADADSHEGSSHVIEEVERHLERYTATPEPPAGDDPLQAAMPQLAQSEREGVRAAFAEGNTIAVVEARFPEVGFEQPFRELLEIVRSWGTVHGTVPGQRDAESGTFHVRLVTSGRGEVFALMRVVGPTGAVVLPCEPRLLFGEPVSDVETHEAPIFLEVEPEVVSSIPPTSFATLRVPVERVDRLLSELGALIQAKMSLDNSALEILETSRDRMQRTTFAQSLRNLDRKIRLLQDEILRVRMVSLTSTFQMLERTLRETCRATGKEARLLTSGEGVELDKRIVEALTEPLVHLVRNAVDHGLEDPATRVHLGKDRVGTVRIEAQPEGGHTILELFDDGAGIDIEGIRQKARHLGLVSENAILPRSELLELIFRAGFTVRDEATAISGRGVGLDAVRQTVADLGGLLEVDTHEEGTRFRLRIPTTLAITQALLLEVRGNALFVPLASVARVANVAAKAIERVGDDEFLVEEDRAIAVRDLGIVLGLGPVDRRRDPLLGVFLGLAEKRLLLLVDRLGGQREIVVRSLGDLLPAIPGISGSTELGDGRTVLILDPAALFDLALQPAAAGVSG